MWKMLEVTCKELRGWSEKVPPRNGHGGSKVFYIFLPVTLSVAHDYVVVMFSQDQAGSSKKNCLIEKISS